MRVYILLFNSGTENEGIHTLQMGNRNKVLMFESEDDATRYALMLEAQDFLSPIVENIDSEEVEAFCRDANYDWEIVKAGELILPPVQNVKQTDWSVQDPSSIETHQETEEESMSSSELDRIRRQLEGLI